MASNKKIDPFLRGHRGSSLAGNLTMSIGRALGAALQVALLGGPLLRPLLSALGARHLPLSFPDVDLSAPRTLLALPLPRLLLVAAGALQGLKQSHWAWSISLDVVRPSSGIEVSAINALMETVYAVLYLCLATSSAARRPDESLAPVQAAGFALFATGLCLEWVSEAQRRRFKDHPASAGKLFTGGLFGLARHINYAGFLMGRAGHAMMASGWVLGVAVGLVFWWDLGGRGVRVLDEYCAKRYGEQWTRYKERVPYKFWPGIW